MKQNVMKSKVKYLYTKIIDYDEKYVKCKDNVQET